MIAVHHLESELRFELGEVVLLRRPAVVQPDKVRRRERSRWEVEGREDLEPLIPDDVIAALPFGSIEVPAHDDSSLYGFRAVHGFEPEYAEVGGETLGSGLGGR